MCCRACVKPLPRGLNPRLGRLSGAGRWLDSISKKVCAAGGLARLNSPAVSEIRGIGLCLLLFGLMFSASNPSCKKSLLDQT
jgi:hypothetical protein